MIIQAVIRYIKTFRLMHDTNCYTLADVIGQNDGKHPIILVLKDADEKTGFYNLSALINTQPVWSNDVSDWASLQTYLTNLEATILSRYQLSIVVPEYLMTKENNVYSFSLSPYRSDHTKQLRIVSADNTAGISQNYASHKYPELMNKSSMRSLMKDVLFISTVGTGVVNLSNSIPVVNGVVCYPLMYNNKMFAINGYAYLKRRNPVCTNSLFLDFTDLGGVTFFKLSDCTKRGIYGTDIGSHSIDTVIKGNPTLYSDTELYVGANKNINYFLTKDITIEFDMPAEATGVPVVCLFGRIFTTMKDRVSYTKIDDHLRVTVKLDRELLRRILVSNQMKAGQKITGTPFYHSYLKDNLDHLFDDKDNIVSKEYSSSDEEIKDKSLDLTVPFVAMIQNSKPYGVEVAYPKLRINAESLLFKKKAGGILMNKNTFEILDYTQIQYLNGTLCTFCHQNHLYEINNDNTNDKTVDQYYVETKQSALGDKVRFEDLHKSEDLVLLDFFYDLEDCEAVENSSGDILSSYEALTTLSTSLTTTEATEEEEDEILTGYEDLVAGTKAGIVLNEASRSSMIISGILSDLCGTYSSADDTVDFKNQIWYLNGDASSYAVYQSNNTWCLGKLNEEPIYQSTDCGTAIQPWYTDLLTWYVASNVNVTKTTSEDLQVLYVNSTSISIPSGKGKITGTYHLVDVNSMFADRQWSCLECLIKYDKTNTCWCIYKGDTLVYKSSKAILGSSPWHHFTWTYMLEE